MHRFFGRLWRQRIDWELESRSDTDDGAQAVLERVEGRLLTMLEMVNEWLQFAEAKNAGLVALDGLALAAILTILPEPPPLLRCDSDCRDCAMDHSFVEPGTLGNARPVWPGDQQPLPPRPQQAPRRLPCIPIA